MQRKLLFKVLYIKIIVQFFMKREKMVFSNKTYDILKWVALERSKLAQFNIYFERI